MDALFIYFCLGLIYIYSIKNKVKNESIQIGHNYEKHRETEAFRKLFDFLMNKGGL